MRCMQELQIQSRNRAPSGEALAKIRKSIVKTRVDVSQHHMWMQILFCVDSSCLSLCD